MQHGKTYRTLVEFHDDVANARTVRELHAVLRATPMLATTPPHVQTQCETCRAARARIEDVADQIHQRIEHDFSLHPPKSEAVAELLDRLRTAAKVFAHAVIESTPASREQSLALTSIETALQQAIAARVRNQD